MSVNKPVVFSGIQATGNLHLGNYLGALQHWVNLQQDYSCIYCVVDMHALTVNPDPADLIRSTREVAATFIAAGIDPERHIVFNQSRVLEHSELAWVFNCIVRMGWMSRMTQFKDKAGKDKENVSLGLFAYPSLMAADILLYQANLVPVGDDQKQHLELTRDVAQKFNNDYNARIQELHLAKAEGNQGEPAGFFTLPEPLIANQATRIMSLKDGTKKMSKSDPSDLSRINLIDDSDVITKKLRKARTDSLPFPEDMAALKERPEAENLVSIYAAFAQTTMQNVIDQFQGKQFSEFKPELIDLVVAKLEPITAELKRLNNDPSYIDDVLKKGADKARHIAQNTMKDVRDIIGFLQ